MDYRTIVFSLAAVCGIGMLASAASRLADASGPVGEEQVVPLTFSGGHDTDRRDGGRPVVLIAAALKVPSDTFRKAFSGVHPSRNGPPSGDEVRQNKRVLMAVLAPLGVTNDRLDEVSNYYRYQPQRGQLWKHVNAAGTATVKDGRVTGITLSNAGAGYSSPPTVAVTVAGHVVTLTATIAFTENLATNGSIERITIAPAAGLVPAK